MNLKVSLRMNKLEHRRMAGRVRQHQRNQKRRRKKRNLPPLSREEGEVGEEGERGRERYAERIEGEWKRVMNEEVRERRREGSHRERDRKKEGKKNRDFKWT